MAGTASRRCRSFSLCLSVAVTAVAVVQRARDAAHWLLGGADFTRTAKDTGGDANDRGIQGNDAAGPLFASVAGAGSTKHPLAQDALDFVLNRRAEYERAGMGVNWNLRGIGFLYTHLEVVLAGEIVRPDPQVPADSNNRHTVRIVNVLTPKVRERNSTTHEFRVAQPLGRDGCDRLTIWVRAAGPEVFAGSAEARASDHLDEACYWAFDFYPSLPGEYTIDAKVLVWNGKNRDYKAEQKCQKWRLGPVPNRTSYNALVSTGFKGFKFYYAEHACCEICSRLQPHCQLWSNPPRHLMGRATRLSDGCELYFDPTTTPADSIPKSWLLQDLNVTFPPDDGESPSSRQHHDKSRSLAAITSQNPPQSHGEPHGGDPQWFVGCGWSNWFTLDFPCLSGDLDDRVYLANETIVVSVPDTDGQPVNRSDSISPSLGGGAIQRTDVDRPLCHSHYEMMGRSEGRWVVLEGDETETLNCPPLVVDKNASQQFDLYRYNGTTTPHCWHFDNIRAIGNRCLEANCKSIRRGSIWNSKFRRPTNATDKTTGRVWAVWRENWCDYVEFTDAQLQHCIDTRKIASIRVEGRSVASFLRSYVDQRLRNIRLYSNATDDPDALDVVVTTLHMLHRVRDSNDGIRQQLRKLKDATPTRPVYYVNGFYTSSERETYTHVERMEDLNRLMDDVLPRKGYMPLNAYDLSAAWTYDTATQRDGMHLIGPPMRMIVTKLFHYLCSDAAQVIGSRRV